MGIFIGDKYTRLRNNIIFIIINRNFFFFYSLYTHVWMNIDITWNSLNFYTYRMCYLSKGPFVLLTFWMITENLSNKFSGIFFIIFYYCYRLYYFYDYNFFFHAIIIYPLESSCDFLSILYLHSYFWITGKKLEKLLKKKNFDLISLNFLLLIIAKIFYFYMISVQFFFNNHMTIVKLVWFPIDSTTCHNFKNDRKGWKKFLKKKKKFQKSIRFIHC